MNWDALKTHVAALAVWWASVTPAVAPSAQRFPSLLSSFTTNPMVDLVHVDNGPRCRIVGTDLQAHG